MGRWRKIKKPGDPSAQGRRRPISQRDLRDELLPWLTTAMFD